jgi:hypothetical protein
MRCSCFCYWPENSGINLSSFAERLHVSPPPALSLVYRRTNYAPRIHRVATYPSRCGALQGVSGSKKLRKRNSRLAFGQFLGGLSETHVDEGFKWSLLKMNFGNWLATAGHLQSSHTLLFQSNHPHLVPCQTAWTRSDHPFTASVILLTSDQQPADAHAEQDFTSLLHQQKCLSVEHHDNDTQPGPGTEGIAL